MIKSVEILGITYSVEEVDVVDKTELCYGQINHFEQTIRIDKNLPMDKKEQTLLHEILHAVCENLGLLEISENEHAIQSISATLYCMFKTQTIFSS